MPTVSISEALAQIQVIDQQIQRKQQLIVTYLLRDANLRDPFERDGGTQAILERERRSIHALEERKILIRRLVQAANQSAVINHGTQTRTIADWLVWKREVSTQRAQFLRLLRAHIDQARRAAGSQGGAGNVVVHVNEKDLAAETENLEELDGYLAGQLALKNATTSVDLPEDTWKTGLEDRLMDLLGKGSSSVDLAGTSSPAAGQGGGLSVWLAGLADPSKKISVIKAVREATRCGLMEAKTLVESAPKVVRDNLSHLEAIEISNQLQAAGARAWVR